MTEIKTLMENKEFSEKIALTETTEEVIAVFAEYGVTVTAEDLDAALAAAKVGGDEISENDLDNVAGGVVASCVALGGLLVTIGDKLGTWKWWRNKLGM